MEWEVYSTIEPWGYDAENWRNANLMATVANFSGNTRRPLKPEQFMPKRESAQDTLAAKIKKLFGLRE